MTSNGVLYFSSARNSGNLDAYTNSNEQIAGSSTWEGDFTPVGPQYVPDQGDYYYWNNFAAPTGQTAREEPMNVGGYDFDVDLFGPILSGHPLMIMISTCSIASGDIVYTSENTQDGTQDRLNTSTTLNNTVQAIIWSLLCSKASAGLCIWDLAEAPCIGRLPDAPRATTPVMLTIHSP